MALEKTSQEYVNLFNTLIDDLMLDNYINFQYVTNNKLKYPIALKKADPISNFHYEVNIWIQFNEEILDMLDESEKLLLFKEALTGLHYDSEKDKITLNQPDVTTFSGFLTKYGSEKVINLKESVAHAFKQIEERNKE